MVILVIASHPDDEVLGVGGTTARYRAEGHIVHERIIGKGRGDELDQRFDTQPLLHYIQQIEAWIQELRPEVVYSHWRGDLNRDHQIVAEAVEVATRPLPGCCVKEVYAFEIPRDRQFVPDVWVPMLGSYLYDKEEQMSIKYLSELKVWPHPRSKKGIEVQAKYRGMQCGHEYAEAFQVVRIVR